MERYVIRGYFDRADVKPWWSRRESLRPIGVVVSSTPRIVWKIVEDGMRLIKYSVYSVYISARPLLVYCRERKPG